MKLTALKPFDAIGFMDGLYYKAGRFNKAYYWNDEEWKKSERNLTILRSDLSKKSNPFSKP